MSYCLICLDDMNVFSKIEEEYLCQLHVVFSTSGSHLKIKPTKDKFFKSEIIYLVYHVSQDRVQTSKENLKAVAEFTPPQT